MDHDDETTILIGASDAESRNERLMLGLLDTPAFIRRGLAVQDAIARVTARCGQQREDWLAGVRLRLGDWLNLIACKPALFQRVSAPATAAIVAIRSELLMPEPRAALFPGFVRPARAWRDLAESVERFNSRWARFATSVDLSGVNAVIDNYNRNYLFEKECLLRSIRVAATGYCPLVRIDGRWILEQFPLLPAVPLDGLE